MSAYRKANLPSVCTLMFVAAHAAAGTPTCSSAAGETKVTWPATGVPVWEMCWVTPAQSSGPRGSGLELRNIHFRGVLVIKRAHAPILFAEYKNAGGGNCYRDWKDTNSSILVEPSLRNQLGTVSAFPVTTNCDISNSPTQAYGSCPFGQPGRTVADCGTGAVAIENLPLGAGMRLTTQYTAGWYKYAARYTFAPNGNITPQFGFGNSDGTYNNFTHWHHNYWRFDFDLNGAANDQVIDAQGVARTTEFSALRQNREAGYSVFDETAGFGYIMSPGSNDNTFPANESGRGFHTADVIASLYKPTEYSDQSTNNLNDCQMTPNTIANGENIDRKDIVMYYRASVRDTTANDYPAPGGGFLAQDSMVCKSVGPSLTLTGSFPVPAGDFAIFRDGNEG